MTIKLKVSHGFYTKQNILTALQIPFVRIVEYLKSPLICLTTLMNESQVSRVRPHLFLFSFMRDRNRKFT